MTHEERKDVREFWLSPEYSDIKGYGEYTSWKRTDIEQLHVLEAAPVLEKIKRLESDLINEHKYFGEEIDSHILTKRKLSLRTKQLERFLEGLNCDPSVQAELDRELEEIK